MQSQPGGHVAATPTPLGPTSDIPPYPTSGEFFAAEPLRYDRDPGDTRDVLVVDEAEDPFLLTPMDRTLVLADGNSLDVPADTPVHGQFASLMAPAERDAIAGFEGATVEDADAHGAALPCGVYGAVDGGRVLWMDFVDMGYEGSIGEGLIPMPGAAVAVDGSSLVMNVGPPLPMVEDVTIDCGGEGPDPQALLDDVGQANEVFVDPEQDAVTAVACVGEG